MRRNLVFVQQEGTLGQQLALEPQRTQELEEFLTCYLERGIVIQDIILALNERGDLTDAEWTSAIYALGYYQNQEEQQRLPFLPVPCHQSRDRAY